MIDIKKTKYLFRSLFSNQYFYRYPSDTLNYLSLYQILSFLYLSTILALLLTFLLFDPDIIYQQFLSTYLQCFYWSAGYFIVKYLLSELLFNFSNKKSISKQMLTLETSYLSSVFVVIILSVWYAFLHLNNYSIIVNCVFLSVLICYSIRVIVLFLNNKNLLSGKVLYIILYLCTLEIVPFIYLFKRYIE